MTREIPRAVRIYRWMLLAYPRWFRAAYGHELEQVFRARHRASRSSMRFWADTAVDAVWSGLLVRLKIDRTRRPEQHDMRARRLAMTAIWQELRYTPRTLRRQPVFSLIVILTLGLGIGATTAIFTLVHGVLLAPLPFPDADRLVRVWEHDTNEGRERGSLSPADFRDYREHATTLVDLAAFTNISAIFTDGEAPERLPAQLVSTGFFEILGVAPLLGRAFRAGDEREATRPVVLSYAYWQSRLAGDSSVIGGTVQFSSGPLTVVGIMPASFRGPDGVPVDFWAPWNLGDDDRRAVHYIAAVGRVRPDVKVETARTELLGIARRLEADFPDVNAGHLVTVTSLEEAIVGDVRAGLWLLLGAVGIVLLIACANLANLFVSRGIARGRDVALRTALGAGRGRLLMQLMTESAMLSIVGGVLGLAVAVAATRAFVALDPGTVPRIDRVRVDLVVAVFTLGVVVVTALLSGGGPALLSTRQHPARALREGGRGTGPGTTGRTLRGTLVVVQVALAVVLLIGAGLLLRSFGRLVNVDPGFDAAHILSARIELGGPRYQSPETIVRFQDELRERLEREPTIDLAGTVSFLPFAGQGRATAWLNILGRPPWDGVPPEVSLINVSGNYFSAIGASLLGGRTFDTRDHREAPAAVVINETLAKMYWDGADALGAQIRLGPNPEAAPYTIIGIVSDVRQFGLREDPFPATFISARQVTFSAFTIVLRVSGDPRDAVGPLREHVATLEPEFPAYDVTTMDDLISASVARPRFSLLMVSAFAIAALVIAAVGIYGVVAYSVAVRSHEFGVRLALGASRSRVLSLVFRQVAFLSITACGIGVAVGIATTRVIRGMLYQVDPVDPVTFTAVPLLLIGVALVAAYHPARRAVRLDPIRALRAE